MKNDTIYAVVRRGKYKGKEFAVLQWRNDWFTLDTEDGKPFAPSSLAFTEGGFKAIETHKNNGTLFEQFRPQSINLNLYTKRRGYRAQYTTSFTRRGRAFWDKR